MTRNVKRHQLQVRSLNTLHANTMIYTSVLFSFLTFKSELAKLRPVMSLFGNLAFSFSKILLAYSVCIFPEVR